MPYEAYMRYLVYLMQLLEGLETAPIVRSNAFHDKGSKPNSNVCK